jgi:hypothetical protein
MHVPLKNSHPFFLSILAHESRNDSVRLNTGLSGVESLSAQKYPGRSNWTWLPGAALAKLCSIQHPVNISTVNPG